MTAQVSEALIYEGEKVDMFSQPLADYFKLSGQIPQFADWGTACQRGYVGTWELSNGRLYLIRIAVMTESGETANYLNTLFPGFPDRVFAHWYSDTLRLPQGQLLEYVHHGYASEYERDLFIEFENGVVVRTYTRENEMDPKCEHPKRTWISRLFGKASGAW